MNSERRHLLTRHNPLAAHAAIHRHTPTTPPTQKPTASAGTLRGIPVIGRDCGGGAIPGTNPQPSP
jgi:hypothetical protein